MVNNLFRFFKEACTKPISLGNNKSVTPKHLVMKTHYPKTLITGSQTEPVMATNPRPSK